MLSRSWKTLSRYFHTVKYLRLQQISGRIWHRLYRPRLSSVNLPRRRLPVGNMREPRFRSPSMTGQDSFVFLNEVGRVVDARDWNDAKREKLWLYNLHYFDDLNSLGAESRIDWHRALIKRWIGENPPTSGNGWEPYPVSLRIVNWIKWDLRTGALDDSAIESLALQLRWLRRRLEYHILGNHLLANAKALIFGGLYFEGSEADEWFRTGRRIFQQQLQEQILADGAHFELSPMYHLIVLEDLLDVINGLKAYSHPVPDDWMATASRMLAWAVAMRHPDGDIPFFNDAAFGVAGTVEELRGYAERLGVKVPASRVGNVFLDASGYIRFENEDAVVFFDAAPVGPDYLPGHTHADTLSLEMSLFGRRLLVNSGTSVYGSGAERQRQRGTGAHNTIVVDEADSSEVWGGFRVARRARSRILELDEQAGIVAAEHDGYRRLPGRPVHRRRIQLGASSLFVTDTITSDAQRGLSHSIRGAWHLHPEVTADPKDIAHTHDGWSINLKLNGPAAGRPTTVNMIIRGADHVGVEPTTWHPEFGLAIPNQRVVFSLRGPLPLRVETILSWE